jgi:hypothetical protein
MGTDLISASSAQIVSSFGLEIQKNLSLLFPHEVANAKDGTRGVARVSAPRCSTRPRSPDGFRWQAAL